jgi:hypothetical protein
MTKKDLVAVINTVVLKGGFKKSGVKWFSANNEIEKTISLQASRFSSKFYLNFGINIIGFDLNGLEYHIFEGFNTSIKNSSNITSVAFRICIVL